ncbi:MAG: hypothetical protein LBC99_00635 [Spirochaetota bacterium]|jgi:hypothetical protein|nr:hypothetical protein [Spirochaetota bacterium]
MDSPQLAGIIRKAASESGRSPIVAFVDKSGLPQLAVLPFAHMNRNCTLVLLMPEAHPATAVLRAQPWVEIHFASVKRDCFARFGGRAFIKQMDGTLDKLIEGYPWLGSWFQDARRQDYVLMQLHTQIIAMEMLEGDSPWYQTSYYRVQNGEVVPINAASTEAMQEMEAGQLETVRRIITQNRSEMIQCVAKNNFRGFANHVSESFNPPEGITVDDWINAQWKLYKSIKPGKTSYNWGLNGFTHKRDGSVECRFFLEITEGTEKRASQHQEIWLLEDTGWKLIRVI